MAGITIQQAGAVLALVSTASGVAYQYGRLRERIAAISRFVSAELRRFAKLLETRMDAVDARLDLIEQFLPHAAPVVPTREGV